MTGGPTTAGNGVPESDPNRDNPFVRLVSGQSVAVVDTFTLECGVTLRSVPVAYKTWGRLNEGGDNVLVVCHALTGSADVESWWKPTIGPDLAFDSRVFFVVCFNVLGSPYGSASPMTLNPETGRRYGPEFPLATVRDDVRIHRLVLESLGVRQVAAVVGGSMGGMQALEWGVMNADIVQNVVALATSGRHSAWCIGWSEGWRRTPGVFPRLRPGAIWKLICFVLLPLLLRAQRQAIFSDPDYADGYYSLDKPPNSGLGIARMAALLTYRSRNSFESRFGRNFMPQPYVSQSFAEKNYPAASPQKPLSPADASVEHHNDGLQGRTQLAAKRWDSCSANGGKPDPQPRVFSAQSYLRHQGENFFKRFDANCYISLTRKLDAHDIARGRPGSYEDVLRGINQAALIIGIESDGLFTISEQYELAEHISDSRMVVINSPEGHDGFLIEFEQVNRHIRRFVQDRLPHLFEASRVNLAEGSAEKSPSGKISGSDRASEAEGGVCAW